MVSAVAIIKHLSKTIAEAALFLHKSNTVMVRLSKNQKCPAGLVTIGIGGRCG